MTAVTTFVLTKQGKEKLGGKKEKVWENAFAMLTTMLSAAGCTQFVKTDDPYLPALRCSTKGAVGLASRNSRLSVQVTRSAGAFHVRTKHTEAMKTLFIESTFFVLAAPPEPTASVESVIPENTQTYVYIKFMGGVVVQNKAGPQRLEVDMNTGPLLEQVRKWVGEQLTVEEGELDSECSLRIGDVILPAKTPEPDEAKVNEQLQSFIGTVKTINIHMKGLGSGRGGRGRGGGAGTKVQELQKALQQAMEEEKNKKKGGPGKGKGKGETDAAGLPLMLHTKDQNTPMKMDQALQDWHKNKPEESAPFRALALHRYRHGSVMMKEFLSAMELEAELVLDNEPDDPQITTAAEAALKSLQRLQTNFQFVAPGDVRVDFALDRAVKAVFPLGARAETYPEGRSYRLTTRSGSCGHLLVDELLGIKYHLLFPRDCGPPNHPMFEVRHLA